MSKDPKHIREDSNMSARGRMNRVRWDREHVPLERQVARESYKARTKNRSEQYNRPLQSKVEENAGRAQVNMPANYAFQKKEW